MGKLRERTLHLVVNRPKTLTYWQIYQDTGITPEWLRAFVNGRARAPSVDLVEKLYVYLSGDELDI